MIVLEWWYVAPFAIAAAAIWYHNKVKDEMFEEGIQYAVVMHHQGKLTYSAYEDDDGDESIEIKMKGE